MEKQRKVRRRKSPKHYILGGVVWALVGSMAGTATYAHLTKNDSQVSTVNEEQTECKVPCQHLHCYMNSQGYVTYLPSEEEIIGDFIKQDNIRQVFTESDIEFAKRLYENGFVLVEDNKPIIQYTEGTVSWGEELMGFDEDGEPIYKCAGFYAYRYNAFEDTFEKSPYISSILNLSEEYPYIKMNNLYEYVDEEQLNRDFQSFFEDDEGDVFDNYDEWFGGEVPDIFSFCTF